MAPFASFSPAPFPRRAVLSFRWRFCFDFSGFSSGDSVDFVLDVTDEISICSIDAL